MNRVVIAGLITCVMVQQWVAAAEKTFTKDGKTYTIVASPEAFAKAFKTNRLACLQVTTKTYVTSMRGIIKACQDIGANPRMAFSPSDLICSNCKRKVSSNLTMALLAPGVRTIGGNSTGKDAFVKEGKCPHCSKTTYCLLSLPNYTVSSLKVTLEDLDKLEKFYRFLAIAWWSQQRRNSAICDRCNTTVKAFTGIARGDIDSRGGLRTSRLHCEKCGGGMKTMSNLASLQKNPSYFGAGMIEKARMYYERLAPTPRANFKQLCRERFNKKMPRGGMDLLSGQPVAAGKGYMFTGGDFLASPQLKQIYMGYYRKKGKSDSEALREYYKLYAKGVIFPHNFVLAESSLKYMLPAEAKAAIIVFGDKSHDTPYVRKQIEAAESDLVVGTRIFTYSGKLIEPSDRNMWMAMIARTTMSNKGAKLFELRHVFKNGKIGKIPYSIALMYE